MLVVLVLDGCNIMSRMFFLVLDLTLNANFWLTELSFFLKKKLLLHFCFSGFKMGTHRRNYSDDEFSVAGEKPEVEFMDFQNDDTFQDYSSEDAPVLVSAPFPFEDGKPKSVLVGETSADTIQIENTSPESVNLWSVRIFSSNPEDSYVLSMMRPPSNDANEEEKQAFLALTSVEDRTLLPGQTLTVWLSCTPKDIGLHTSIVHVDIGDEKIERVAFLLADDNVSKALFSHKPYSRRRGQVKKFEPSPYVPGCRPTQQHTQGFKHKLRQYAIPAHIRELIESKQKPDVLYDELSMMNYAEFFSALIVMEELNMEVFSTPVSLNFKLCPGLLTCLFAGGDENI